MRQPGANEANALISNSLLKYSSPFFSSQEKALKKKKRNRLGRGGQLTVNGKGSGNILMKIEFYVYYAVKTL